jgi:hypothetical protein
MRKDWRPDMRNEHDDDLPPTVEQRRDVETEGFSELDDNMRDEERKEEAANDTEDDEIVGK